MLAIWRAVRNDGLMSVLPTRHTAEFKNDAEVVGEIAEAVVAAIDHKLPRAAVFLDRVAVIEHLVSSLDEQQLAGRGDRADLERAQFGDVLHG